MLFLLSTNSMTAMPVCHFKDHTPTMEERLKIFKEVNETYYNGAQRDLKNWPTESHPDQSPPARLVVVPDSWFAALYNKSGVSGGWFYYTSAKLCLVQSIKRASVKHISPLVRNDPEHIQNHCDVICICTFVKLSNVPFTACRTLHARNRCSDISVFQGAAHVGWSSGRNVWHLCCWVFHVEEAPPYCEHNDRVRVQSKCNMNQTSLTFISCVPNKNNECKKKAESQYVNCFIYITWNGVYCCSYGWRVPMQC